MDDNSLYEAIRRYALRLLSDYEAAMDVAQEVFLRLEQNRDGVEQPRAWAYRAARNLVIDHYRKKGSRKIGGAPSGDSGEPLQDIPAEATRFNPAILAEKKENIEMIHEKMNELPPRHREVLRLKFQEGLKYAEIAEVLDVSVATVGWLLHEAIGKLRKELVPAVSRGD